MVTFKTMGTLRVDAAMCEALNESEYYSIDKSELVAIDATNLLTEILEPYQNKQLGPIAAQRLYEKYREKSEYWDSLNGLPRSIKKLQADHIHDLIAEIRESENMTWGSVGYTLYSSEPIIINSSVISNPFYIDNTIDEILELISPQEFMVRHDHYQCGDALVVLRSDTYGLGYFHERVPNPVHKSRMCCEIRLFPFEDDFLKTFGGHFVDGVPHVPKHLADNYLWIIEELAKDKNVDPFVLMREGVDYE